MSWISTEDKMPHEIGNYLIYYCEYWNHDKPCKIAWAFYNSWNEWCIDNSKVIATHWMPLPDPPQQTR